MIACFGDFLYLVLNCSVKPFNLTIGFAVSCTSSNHFASGPKIGNVGTYLKRHVKGYLLHESEHASLTDSLASRFGTTRGITSTTSSSDNVLEAIPENSRPLSGCNIVGGPIHMKISNRALAMVVACSTNTNVDPLEINVSKPSSADATTTTTKLASLAVATTSSEPVVLAPRVPVASSS